MQGEPDFFSDFLPGLTTVKADPQSTVPNSHPIPILCAIKWPDIAPDNEGIRVAVFEPHLTGVPFAFFRVQNTAGLPETVFLYHFNQYDHAEYWFIFTLSRTIIAQLVGRGFE